MEVEVEYNYEAEQPDELTIKAGDIIKNVTISEGGWWEGEINGRKGMFPDNFVKVIKSQDKEPKKDEGKKKDVQAQKRQSVKDLANKIKGQVHEGGPPMIRKKEPATRKKKAKCVYSYEPENEDELKLEVGDMLDVIKQEEEGWWEGILNGKQGMFPSNFVEIVDESAEATDNSEKMENTEEHLIKGKKVHGIGLGNIFGDGPIKLRSTGGKKPGDKPQEPPKAEKREDPAQRRLKGFKDVPEIYNNDSSGKVQHDHARSPTKVENVFSIAEKHPSFCENIDYIDSDTVYLDDVDLNVLNNDKKSNYVTNYDKAILEKELIEFDDVDIDPESSDCKNHKHLEIKQDFAEEDSDSTEDCCGDIDCNNNRGPGVKNRSYQQAAQKKEECVQHEHKCAGDYTESLKSILDDLDICLNDTSSESGNDGSTTDEDLDKDADVSIPSALVEKNKKTDVDFKKPVTALKPKEYDKKLQSLNCWKHTELTPPERQSFCKAIDSVLVTKKRLIDSAEKNPNQTPLHHHQFQEFGNMEKAARALNYAAGDLGASGFMKFSVVVNENGSTALVAKPVELHNRTDTRSSPDKAVTPERPSKKSSSKSPKTYFESLNKSGHLSPFIKSIADKYQLFGSDKPHFKQYDVNDYQEADDLEDSYIIGLLGHQADESFSMNQSKSELPSKEEGDLSDPLVNQMVNNYVYDVITGEHAGTLLKGSDLDEADIVTELNENHKIEDDISMAVCIDDNSVRFVNSKEDLGDSYIDKSESSTLLFMTEGSDLTYVDNILRAEEKLQSTPFKEKYLRGSPQMYPRESEVHVVSDEPFPPRETKKCFQERRNALASSKHFPKFISLGSMRNESPESVNKKNSSSYCRIPFSSNAPTFWYSKDFTESPKSKPVSLMKLRSPKRTSSELTETVPSLHDIAEKSHLEEFKGKIEAFRMEYPNITQDKSPHFLDHRSPVKKRRKRSSEQYISDYYCRHPGSALNTNCNAIAPLPFDSDCSSVETFFTSTLDDQDDVNTLGKTERMSDTVASSGKQLLQPKVNPLSCNEDVGFYQNLSLFRKRPSFLKNKDHSKEDQYDFVKAKTCFYDDTARNSEKKKKASIFPKRSSSDTKESPVKLLSYRKIDQELYPLEVDPLKSTEKETLNIKKKKKFVEKTKDFFKSFDLYTKSTLEHQSQKARVENKTYQGENPANASRVKVDDKASTITNDCMPKQEHSPKKCTEADDSVNEGSREAHLVAAAANIESTVSSYFGCDNDIDESPLYEKETSPINENEISPIKVHRNVLLLASLGVTSCTENSEEIEKAVDNHIKTTDEVIEGNSYLAELLESRNNMYSVISDAVQSCSEQEDKKDEISSSTDSVRKEMDQDFSRNEDGCDVTPDIDALVSDLQGLDLSDTPQYAHDQDNEMNAFLKEALGSLDDIMAESFTSTGTVAEDETSLQRKEECNDTVEIQDDSVLNIVGEKCILHESEEVCNENELDVDDECEEIVEDPVLMIVGKKCVLHQMNANEKGLDDTNEKSSLKSQKAENMLPDNQDVNEINSACKDNWSKNENLVDICENVTEDSFDRSLMNKGTQSSPQEMNTSTQTRECQAANTSVDMGTQTDLEDLTRDPYNGDESDYFIKEDLPPTMDYDEAYDVDGNKIDDCKAAAAFDSYYVYERQPTYLCTSSLIGYYHSESVLKFDDDAEGEESEDEDDDNKPICQISPINEVTSKEHLVGQIDYYDTESPLERPDINFDLDASLEAEESGSDSDDELNRTRGSSLDADLITEANETDEIQRNKDNNEDGDEDEGDIDESFDVEDIKARMQDSGKWLEEYIRDINTPNNAEGGGDSDDGQETALSDLIPAEFEEKLSFYPSPQINVSQNSPASYGYSPDSSP